MKNGFDLINTVRVECYRLGLLMTEVHYSLKGQYAVFSARQISEPTDGLSHSVFLFTPTLGFVLNQSGMMKAEASKALINRFDILEGDA